VKISDGGEAEPCTAAELREHLKGRPGAKRACERADQRRRHCVLMALDLGAPRALRC
jgi:hypothetical protein